VENKMHYLLGAKPGDHQHLFDQAIEQMDRDNYRTETYQVASAEKKIGIETSYVAGLLINKTHADAKVNFLQHHEFDCSTGAVIKRFSWVTDLDLSEKSLHKYQQAGRWRWRIENETFNTLTCWSSHSFVGIDPQPSSSLRVQQLRGFVSSDCFGPPLQTTASSLR